MKTSSRCRAFSLVEVVLALGIVSFCLLTLLSLVPVGLGSTRDSLQKTVAAGIVTQIVGDLNATPAGNNLSMRFQINLNSSGTSTLFFASDGTYSNSLPSGSLYQATVVISPPSTSTGKTPTVARIIISWPGLTGTAHSIPSTYQGYYEVLTALDRN